MPLVSGTGATIEEGWLMDVVLLVTVGVVLLSCAGTVFVFHPPTGNAHMMREPLITKQESCLTLRSMRAETINHRRENVESLTVFCRSATAADGVIDGTVGDTLVQFLRCISIMGEDQTMFRGNYRVG